MSAVATWRQNRAQHPILRRLLPLVTLPMVTLGLILGLTPGCERSEALKSSEAGSTAKGENLPFHEDSGASSNVAISNVASSNKDGSATPGVSDPKQLASLPFRVPGQPRLLAAGTLLTVQLQESLSTARAHAGDQFSAVVTTPLTVGQDILVDSGTVVTGRIESEGLRAGHPGQAPGAGYFRLTLSSITVEGRQLAVRTSSLFARGTVQSKSIAVQEGHRLTFRLTDPVVLDETRNPMHSQSPSPASP
jgi:hypothetical protein